MDSFISEEVRSGLEQARKRALKSSNRICVHMGDSVFRVTQVTSGGFSLPADVGEELRGLVDIYDGPKHLCQCLIVCSQADGDQVHYEYKRTTAVGNQAPVDYVLAEDAPVALLTR